MKALEIGSDELHIVPEDDLREHDASSTCWCCPAEDCETLGLWIHNALDGRERYETGELRLH